MNRRSVIAAGVSSTSLLGLSGCLLWNIGGTSKVRLEAETMTRSEVCSWPVTAVENLDSSHRDPVEDAIETGNATGDYATEEALFISDETNYFYIDITNTGDEADYSVEHAFDTQDQFCAFTVDRLVHSVDPVTVDIEVLKTLRTAIRDGTFESEPPSDAAEATVDYLRDTVGTLFEDEFFLELDDQYYHIHYHWESGE